VAIPESFANAEKMFTFVASFPLINQRVKLDPERRRSASAASWSIEVSFVRIAIHRILSSSFPLSNRQRSRFSGMIHIKPIRLELNFQSNECVRLHVPNASIPQCPFGPACSHASFT
jgi:hypothetical protein